MGSADDRAPRADAPDALTPADMGIAGPSAPTVAQSSSADRKRVRLIRAWVQTTVCLSDPVRGYDPRYACPDMTRERAAAEAAAAAAMARMGPIE